MDVILSKNATKQFNRLPKAEQSKIRKKLIALKEDPYSGKQLSGDLNGLFSLKAWPYRIIYEVNKKKRRVEVNKIVHRQGAYKN
ncbi:MAG: hypothetical protein A3H50_03705 [Candidatus Levybacteria bacterium RIFCSPLOWO2_02_FULL_37_10]|nr:MAG: hypothetical protein A2860_04395 [Candidatus Levybacteria bacterium RIFCSPHIGHO2_01_FULL_37_33]OGH16876.1 MAG: hypothetical protein A3C97_03385 [Candidatus Levybacteria bacterium RIFCSPHIGHO2_02_FULL_37_11]OGH30051.1 MAG: hypothetical protein A3F30_04200 [Candidatus Levybacteria bacterium RIFCSPHIGHO2_12_FULL_37_12]OGH43978.1 MAG: hypothetical protein A3H50_03705 [Candidatus Levybacteria bacterium RIFCSPLOWO2_02_FULL_37_10]